MVESDSVKVERPLFMQPWPGYWRTKGRLKRLMRFQDLIRHREHWAGDIDLAQPIEKLFPKISKDKAYLRLDREIAQLQKLVYWDLNIFSLVNTAVVWRDRNEPDDAKKNKNYDLVLDYFRLPRVSGHEHDAFENVMRVLNNGVGVLEARKKRAFWDMFNPIMWLAYLIRIPITVMERAGFGGHEKTQELLIGSYAMLMKVAMILILGLVALKAGIEVPWKGLVERIIGLVAK